MDNLETLYPMHQWPQMISRQPKFVINSKTQHFTFVLSFFSGLKVPPLCAHQSTEFSKGEVRVLGLDDGSHFTAEEDVATHVDLPLRPLLL